MLKEHWRQWPFAVLFLLAGAVSLAADPATEDLVVTANREPLRAVELIGNTARVGSERIAVIDAQHVYELGTQATGTWISRGSGQEHLTAIRSPVLTGPGACAAFLTLEDSIPTRPAGFCNVNQLFEIPSELAQATEVVRGPSNALYGSNGLHGTLNFLLPQPGTLPGLSGSMTAGPNDFARGAGRWDGQLGSVGLNGGVLLDHYGGWRDDSGYDQQKAYLRASQQLQHGVLRYGLSASNLDQDTAGFIRGEDAYKDADLRSSNPDAGAYRKADSQRLFMHFSPNPARPGDSNDWRVFVRRSDMDFLQHFLPGKPVEQNGQVSGGIMLNAGRDWLGGRISFGFDAEVADGYLKEQQALDLGPDSNRPPGWHYDYDVTSMSAGTWAQLNWPLNARWELQAGLRAEYLGYDYDNQLSDGNTRDDGSSCTNGCLFFRPADRHDDYFEIAPNAGLLLRIDDISSAYLNVARGFRMPQATELYRLQSGQSVGDLQPETIDSIEIGWHRDTGALRVELAGFAMRKRNSIFNDADGVNVSDGRSKSVGVEMQTTARSDSGWYAGLAATWARHQYDFDRMLPGTEAIHSGNDEDTAPRTLGSARVGFDAPRWLAEMEWVHLGDYFLDPANSARYPGHDLANLRALWRVTDQWSVVLRVNNLTDEYYADRADFAFGSYRYLPGRDREVLLQVAYRRF